MKKHLVFFGVLSLLLTGCSHKQQLQEKQLEWKQACERMMLKGADGLLAHHDCFNRCIKHYQEYCSHRCKQSLREAKAGPENVQPACREHMTQFIPKKCHYLCGLSSTELQAYRLSFIKKIQGDPRGEAACHGSSASHWSKKDYFPWEERDSAPLEGKESLTEKEADEGDSLKPGALEDQLPAETDTDAVEERGPSEKPKSEPPSENVFLKGYKALRTFTLPAGDGADSAESAGADDQSDLVKDFENFLQSRIAK